MIDFLKKSTWSFSSIIIKSMGSLVTNKLFAMYFGTTGITLFAHFQNLISLVTQVPNDGINRGIIKYWSSPGISADQKQKYFITGFIMNLAMLIITLLLLFIFRAYFFRDFRFNLNIPVLVLLVMGITLYIFHLFLLSIILSFQEIKAYALINALGSIIVVLAVFFVSGERSLANTLIAFILAQSVALSLSLIYSLRRRFIRIDWERISDKDFKRLGEFVLMAISVLIFGKVTDFVIRDYAIQSFGMHQTGLWQSVVKLSDGYMMLFINTVGIVYYPQVSSMILNTDHLRQYLRDVLKVVVVVSAIGLFGIYFFRKPVLILLYNQDFVPAGDLMPFQFVGDFFCIIAYLLTYIISAQARTRTFIILQAASAIFYTGLIVLFSTPLGIEGIPIAHAIRYLVLAIILIILNKRIII
jgi:O-antigen/teichoic acid export membrane protein